MINDFKIRNLPPEQFNRLVDWIEDILFRKDIDEEKLKTEFKNVLNHEKILLITTKTCSIEIYVRWY